MNMTARVIQDGRYTIKCWPDGDGFSGRAMIGLRPITLQLRAATADAVLALVGKAVQRHRADLSGGRGPSDIPQAGEYEEVLQAVNGRMTDAQTQMLRALFEAPQRTLTATQLAMAAGQSNFSYSNLHFGLLARMVAEEIGYAPEQRPDGTIQWTTTLAVDADGGTGEEGAHFRWRMRPEVADALSGVARIVLSAPTSVAKSKG